MKQQIGSRKLNSESVREVEVFCNGCWIFKVEHELKVGGIVADKVYRDDLLVSNVIVVAIVEDLCIDKLRNGESNFFFEKHSTGVLWLVCGFGLEGGPLDLGVEGKS